MASDESQDTWTFSGFRFPTYTQIPDQLFDELLPILSGAEVKVLLYICRRTFGFKRESDNISLNQMLQGITKKDGSQLDLGTGLSKPTLLRALKSLQEKEILIAERQANDQQGNMPTNYRLHIVDTPRSKNESTLGKKMSLGEAQNFTKPLVKKYYPQETVVQQTDLQETETTTTGDDDGTNNDDSAMDPNVVVALLQEQGVSGGVARRLAENFDEETIKEKIEFVEFLVAEGRVKNPAGWLRTAIEEDYAKPDGFLGQVEREHLAQLEALRAEEAAESVERRKEEFQRKADERERVQSEFEKRLHERYGMSEKEREHWRAVLAQEGGQFSPSIYAILQSCYLLTLQNDVALIGTETEHQYRQIQHPGIAVVLKRLFRSIIGEEPEIEYVLLDMT
jgi:DNA-binding transcriptional ArsR family regulator